jgi:hypothetical protein
LERLSFYHRVRRLHNAQGFRYSLDLVFQLLIPRVIAIKQYMKPMESTISQYLVDTQVTMVHIGTSEAVIGITTIGTAESIKDLRIEVGTEEPITHFEGEAVTTGTANELDNILKAGARGRGLI